MPDVSDIYMLTAELALFRFKMIAHNAAVFSFCPSLMTELTYTANSTCAKGLFTAASAECEANALQMRSILTACISALAQLKNTHPHTLGSKKKNLNSHAPLCFMFSCSRCLMTAQQSHSVLCRLSAFTAAARVSSRDRKFNNLLNL